MQTIKKLINRLLFYFPSKHYRMKEMIIKGYSKLGIEISSNDVLTDYLELLEDQPEILRNQFELFHLELILSLYEIKKHDTISFDRYVKRINETRGKVNFWGEKFEVFIHSKLLKANFHIKNNLKRGIDGIEPDLTFNFNNSQLGIELTSLRFIESPKNKEVIINKVAECMLNKNNKPYANDKCVLLIDITNIIAYEKLLSFNINQIFKEEFHGFNYLGREINLGMVVLCNFVFKQRTNGDIYLMLNPRLGFMSEKKQMNTDLKKFIDIVFNGFKPDDDFDISFYHKNL